MTPVDVKGWRAMDEKPPLLRPRILIVYKEAQVVAEFLDEADRDEALHRCLTFDEVVEALDLARGSINCDRENDAFNKEVFRRIDAALAKARTRG